MTGNHSSLRRSRNSQRRRTIDEQHELPSNPSQDEPSSENTESDVYQDQEEESPHPHEDPQRAQSEERNEDLEILAAEGPNQETREEAIPKKRRGRPPGSKNKTIKAAKARAQEDESSDDGSDDEHPIVKRPRGRPPGSRSKPKNQGDKSTGRRTSAKPGDKRAPLYISSDNDDSEADESTQPKKRVKTGIGLVKTDIDTGLVQVPRLELGLGVAFTAKGKPSRKGISQRHQRAPPRFGRPSAEEIFSGQPCEEHLADLKVLFPSGDAVQLSDVDAAILKAHNLLVHNEIQLWAICWQRFQSTPYEIFKYGLWLELKDNRAVTVAHGDGESGKFISPFLSKGDIDALRLLVSLPCWDDRIEKLRYVLMCAVSYRIKDHDEPLVPIRAKYLRQFEERLGSIPLDPDQKSLWIYDQAKDWIVDDPIIKKICTALHSISPSQSPETDTAKHIFLLKTADLPRVLKAINMVVDKVNGHLLIPYPDHCEAYWEAVGRHLVPKQWPTGRDLEDCRKSTILNFRMAHQCRLAIQKRGIPYRGAPHFLYLVDSRDRASTAHFYDNIQPGLCHGNIRGPTQTQLDVIRGLILPARGPYLELMTQDGPAVTDALIITSPRGIAVTRDPLESNAVSRLQEASDEDHETSSANATVLRLPPSLYEGDPFQDSPNRGNQGRIAGSSDPAAALGDKPNTKVARPPPTNPPAGPANQADADIKVEDSSVPLLSYDPPTGPAGQADAGIKVEDRGLRNSIESP